MIPFNNPNATQFDLIANAGGPLAGDLISNVGGGTGSGSNIGDLIEQETFGYILLETGSGFIQLEA